MKTNLKSAKRWVTGLSFLLLASFGIIVSCKKEDIRPANISSSDNVFQDKDLVSSDEVCGSVLSKDLLLENGFKVGDIQIYNDAQYLYVSAKVLARFKMGTAYLYIGDEKGIPMSESGEIVFQKFNYIHRVNQFDLQNSHYYKIPLNTVSSKNFVVLNIQVFHFDALINAWAMGGFVNDSRHPEIFSFDRTLCDLNNETKY